MASSPWREILQINQLIRYRSAGPPSDYRHTFYQPAGLGPYTARVVDVLDWGVGVRADGYDGSALLYYVKFTDILCRVAE